MFVLLSNGGVLELFRLYRPLGDWSRSSARSFLYRFRREGDSLRALRRLLSDRRGAQVVRLNDDALLRAASAQIISGELVIVHASGGYRWEGPAARMAEFLVLRRDGIHGVTDAATLTHCLEAIIPDASPLRSLKDMLPQWMFDPQIPPSDSELMDLLKQAIREGEIVAAYHWPHGHTDVATESPQASAPAPERSAPPPPEPDPITFQSGHNPADQGATLRAAAAAGVPFCEICEREHAGGARPR